MAVVLDFSKITIGDQVRLGEEKYEIAGMDAPWESNASMKIRSITLHLKALGYRGISSVDEIRGDAEFRKTIQNDHTAPPGSQDPLAGQDKNLNYDAGFVDEDAAKKARAKQANASQNGTATDEGMPEKSNPGI